MENILVICMGNICRSPMAEGLLKEYLKQNSKMKVHSCGITALVNKPADVYAQEVMMEKKKIDISTHRARQANKTLLHEADLILVMEQNHLKEIEFQYPTVCGRVHRLGRWKNFDIPDPYKQSKNFFEQTLSLIDDAINEWQVRLW